MKHLLTSLFLVYVLASCNFGKDISDSNVVRPTAENTCSLAGTALDLGKDAPLGISDIFVKDSLLILKTARPASMYHFSVYLLPSMEFKGNYVAKGRGPGELLNPLFVGKDWDGMLLFDLSLNKLFRFEVEASIKSGKAVISHCADMPPRALDVLPYGDSSILVKIPETSGIAYRDLRDNGCAEVSDKSFLLYPHVSGINCFDKLSSADKVRPDSRYLAVAMCMFPQINIIDLDGNDRTAVAVSEDYRHWKQRIRQGNDKQTICYMSLNVTMRHIAALYFGQPFMEWIEQASIPHLHIFDWDGRFIFDISLDRRIKSFVLDEKSEFVYGLDVDDNVYRYDVRKLKL